MLDGFRVLIFGLVLVVGGCKVSEVGYGKSSLDPHPVDSDNDMLTDFEEEVFTRTNPHNADTDGDGLPDGWEWFSGLDPLNSAGLDGPDGDPYNEGITNKEKYRENPDRYKDRGQVYVAPQ